MEKKMKHLFFLQDRFQKLPALLIKYKTIVWMLFIAGTLFMAVGIGKIRQDTSMDSVFPEGHPIRESYIKLREQFGSDKVLSILYRAKDGDIFSEQSLKALHGIHNDLVEYRDNPAIRDSSALKHVDQIIDLINVSFLESSKETVMVARNFIGKNLPKTKEEREKIRHDAVTHKDYPSTFFDKNTEYGLIFITTDFGAIPKSFNKDEVFLDEEEYTLGDLEHKTADAEFQAVEFEQIDNEECSDFMKEIRAIVEKPEYKDVVDIYYVGDVVMYAFDHDVIDVEAAVIFSCIVLLFFVILGVMFKSAAAIVWAICIDIAAVIWLLGTMGWVGTVQSELIQPLAFLTLIIGIADCVHLLSGYMFSRKSGNDHNSALASVLRRSGVACLLTSVTTLIGFVSIASVELIELQVFGIYAGIGIFWAFVLAILVLPVMIDSWAPIPKNKVFSADLNPQTQHALVQNILMKISVIVLKRPKTILAISAMIILFAIPGLTKLRIDTNPIEALKKSTEVRQSFDVMEKAMVGTQSMHILIDAQTSGAMRDMDMLYAIEAMETYIRTHPSEYLVDSGSLLIALKNSNKAIHGGDLTYYRIPDDEKLVQQLFFLFQNADPMSNRMLVSDDYSMSHIGITLKNAGSSNYVDVIDDLKKKAEEIFKPLYSKYPKLNVQFTGDLAVQMEMYHIMSWAQVKSFGLAFVVITVILLVLFGSWELGLIAMIPNIVPVVVTFGLMGWFNIPIDIVAVIIAPIVIGIVVDDTIHLSTHYKMALKNTGSVDQAISIVINEVGQALIVTTFTVGLGLLSMMYSSHMGFTYLGVLGALAMFIALVCDLLLFPVLLCQVGKFKKTKEIVESKIESLG